MFTLAVLMTCYNRVAVTRRCLQRLFRCPLPENWRLAVWLVDDASPDRTGDIVVREFPAVHVIPSPGNLFWCKGMRLAWDTAAVAQDYDAYLCMAQEITNMVGERKRMEFLPICQKKWPVFAI